MIVEYKGQNVRLSLLCAKKKMSEATVRARLNRGLTIYEALNPERINGVKSHKLKARPRVTAKRMFEYNGKIYMTLADYCRESGESAQDIYNIVKRYGKTYAEAININKANKANGRKNKSIVFTYAGKEYKSARQFCVENTPKPNSSVVIFANLLSKGLGPEQAAEKIINSLNKSNI